jgi:hypothetical protein
LGRLEGFEDAHAVYAGSSKPEERKHNRSSPSEKDRFVAWPELQRIFRRQASVAPETRTLSPRDLALYGLYVAIPSRRILDYQEMRVAAATKKRAVDVGGLPKVANWLVLSKAGVPMKLVINRYKTSKRYGTYIREELPQELASVLQDYIKAAGLRGGDPVFPTSSGGHYTSWVSCSTTPRGGAQA